MIERDDHIPPLEELLIELEHARTIANDILSVSKEATLKTKHKTISTIIMTPSSNSKIPKNIEAPV